MFNSRRPPEIVIYLRVSEKSVLNRLLEDEKVKVIEQWEKENEKRSREKEEERRIALEEKEKELWEDPDFKEGDEEAMLKFTTEFENFIADAKEK